MKGQLPICMTCQSQIRPQGDVGQATCSKDAANVIDEHCADYRILPGDHLGPRLAEIYGYITRIVDGLNKVVEVVNLYHPIEEEEEP